MTRDNDGDAEAAQQAALRALEPFAQRLLPAMLRRHLARRGHPEAAAEELLLDLRQELHVDCLQNRDLVLALPARERHRRWFRMVERWVYRQRLDTASARAEPPCERSDDELEPVPANLRRLLPDAPLEVLDRLATAALQHGNGRCHVHATSLRLGVPPRQVRRLWSRAAERLGFGQEFVAFWQRRLAEALVGLAADVLVDDGSVHLLPRPRSRPDPRGRLRRIRRIHSILRVRPLRADLRKIMGPLLRRADPRAVPPAVLLAQAAELAPEWPAVPLWQFEAAQAAGDHPAMQRAIRCARELHAAPHAVALCRARLLECRGRLDAGLRLLARAVKRPGGGPLCAVVG